MRVILICTAFIYCISIHQLSAQKDSALVSTPSFEIGASYIANPVCNTMGGIKQGFSYLGMANLKILLDTKGAELWNGGQLFLNIGNTHGDKPSDYLFGDFQGAINIEAENMTYIHELWYKQKLGSFDLTIGIQDLNTEFVSSNNASVFLNSSFGTHSTIADNVPAPVFPLTAIGLQLKYSITNNFSGKIIVFNGFPAGSYSNTSQFRFKYDTKDGLLAVSEFTLSSNEEKKLKGTYKIGGYMHNHLTDNSNDSIQVSPNYGIYLVSDQMIYKNSSGKNISLFTQASISPSQKNYNWYYLGMGINFYNLFSKKKEDITGLAIAHCGISNLYHKSETALELTYKFHVGKYLFIQPDIQYILNPSGTEMEIKNALIAGIRIGLEY